MKFAKLITTASYLPKSIVSNKELEKVVDTTDTWIRERTGIEQRQLLSPGQSVVTLATQAVNKLLAKVDLDPSKIDLLLVATSTNYKLIPSVSCKVQHATGLKDIPAFDINAACSGFVYALSTAEQFIKAGMYKNIIIVGADAMSQIIDWEDRSTCVLFGDGGAAALISSSDTPGIYRTLLGADGAGSSAIETKGNILSAAESPFIVMKGKDVFKKAVSRMSRNAKDILLGTDFTLEDISWVIPHQANKRIIEASAKQLGLSMDKVILTVNKHANTSAASIPLALDHAIETEQVKTGDLLLLNAFGAGFTWGSSLLHY
ncbi:MAG: beta-ketoacyl-ACP synthase III [Pseudomonadota bacterium]|nr:beta-ketoacyl-ACP synthase III [Pseudomonadota bacterium]